MNGVAQPRGATPPYNIVSVIEEILTRPHMRTPQNPITVPSDGYVYDQQQYAAQRHNEGNTSINAPSGGMAPNTPTPMAYQPSSSSYMQYETTHTQRQADPYYHSQPVASSSTGPQYAPNPPNPYPLNRPIIISHSQPRLTHTVPTKSNPVASHPHQPHAHPQSHAPPPPHPQPHAHNHPQPHASPHSQPHAHNHPPTQPTTTTQPHVLAALNTSHRLLKRAWDEAEQKLDSELHAHYQRQLDEVRTHAASQLRHAQSQLEEAQRETERARREAAVLLGEQRGWVDRDGMMRSMQEQALRENAALRAEVEGLREEAVAMRGVLKGSEKVRAENERLVGRVRERDVRIGEMEDEWRVAEGVRRRLYWENRRLVGELKEARDAASSLLVFVGMTRRLEQERDDVDGALMYPESSDINPPPEPQTIHTSSPQFSPGLDPASAPSFDWDELYVEDVKGVKSDVDECGREPVLLRSPSHISDVKPSIVVKSEAFKENAFKEGYDPGWQR